MVQIHSNCRGSLHDSDFQRKNMTNEATRTELLKVLAELSKLHPDWRLGQMLANLAMSAGRTEASGVWDLEDDEALSAASRRLERRHEHFVLP